MKEPVPFDKPLYVTKPVLPDFADFTRECEQLWEERILTNDGPRLRSLEAAISRQWCSPNVMLFANGTLALELACRALELRGEVITTPFTFPATVHVLSWLGLTPVLCDIDPDTLNIDPAMAGTLVTSRTSAILGVHVFGHPCAIESLECLSSDRGLKLVFDAAHAYGASYRGRPLPTYGDVSMVSLHATKLFHSIEGGVLHYTRPEMATALRRFRNFGIDGEAQINGVGVNAKMSELHALIGLLLIDRVSEFVRRRRLIAATYAERLAAIDGISLISAVDGEEANHAYMPVRINAAAFGLSRDELQASLARYNVVARRYFYPLVSDYGCYGHLFDRTRFPVAVEAADQILTLPIYPDLSLEDVHRVCDAIAWCQQTLGTHLRQASV